MCVLTGSNVEDVTARLSRMLGVVVTRSTTIEQLYWRMKLLADRVGPVTPEEQSVLNCYATINH